jgi:hypothetical protein
MRALLPIIVAALAAFPGSARAPVAIASDPPGAACPLPPANGDSLVANSPKFDWVLDSVWCLGSDLLEHQAVLFHDVEGDTDVALILPDSMASGCAVTPYLPASMLPSWSLIARVHNHPDSVAPGTCRAAPAGGYATPEPSPYDRKVADAEGIPEYIVSRALLEVTRGSRSRTQVWTRDPRCLTN